MRMFFIATAIVIGLNEISLAQDAKDLQQSRVAPSELNRILEAERSVFGTLHLAPILVPEGEQVGDLMNATTTTLIARAEDCFNQLVPRSSPSSLPAMTVLSENGLAAALGLSGAGFNALASGGASDGTSFVLDFKEVEVRKVSLVQLRTSLKRDVPECDQVRPFIDGFHPVTEKSRDGSGNNFVYKKNFAKGNAGKSDTTLALALKLNDAASLNGTIVSDKPPPLLLGTVFTARRVVRVRTSNVTDVKAKLSLAQKILAELGLGASFEITSGGVSESSDSVEIEGKESVPVAFAPAFFVQGSKRLANGQMAYDIANIDSDALEDAVEIASSLKFPSHNHEFEDLTDIAALDYQLKEPFYARPGIVANDDPNGNQFAHDYVKYIRQRRAFLDKKAILMKADSNGVWKYSVISPSLAPSYKYGYANRAELAKKTDVFTNVLGIGKRDNLFIID